MASNTYFRIGKQIFISDKRKKIETVNAEGSGISYGLKLFGAEEISAAEGYYGGGEVYATLYKKGEKIYERVGFDHFNGHFSGYTEGVYEIRFRELVPKKA